MTRALPLFAVLAAGLAAQPRLSPLDESAYKKLLAENKGRVLLVDFWATWCIPCREEMPHVVQLGQKYRARGLRLVTVSCDETDQEKGAEQFLDKNAAPQPRYLKRAADDDKFINSVDQKWSGALPALFLYDRQGRIVKSFVGETDLSALEAAVRRAL